MIAFLLQRRRRRDHGRDRPRLRLGVTCPAPRAGAGRGSLGSSRPGPAPALRRCRSCRVRAAGLYGGTLGFEEPRVFANFVADDRRRRSRSRRCPASNKLIAGRERRRPVRDGAAARRAPTSSWSARGRSRPRPRGAGPPAQAFPDAGDGVRGAARAARPRRRPGGRRADPQRPRRHRAIPAFAAGALVLTTDEGAGAARRSRSREQIVVARRRSSIGRRDRSPCVHDRGHALDPLRGRPAARRARCSPTRLVDELFLTVSPLLTGRDRRRSRASRSSRAPTCSTAAGRSRAEIARRPPRRRPPLPALPPRHHSEVNPDAEVART